MKKLAVALGAMVCALCASGSAVAGPVFDLSATTLDARNNSGQNTF